MALPASVQALVRIDFRRPAAWVSLAMAFVAAVVVPVAWSGPPALALAGACGGLAAVAAMGVPAGRGADHAAVSIGRLAWPIGGVVAGVTSGSIMSPSPAVWQVGVALVAAVVATGWAEHQSRRIGCTPEQAASLALALSAAAAGAAVIPGTSAMSAVVSSVAWAGLAIAAFAMASWRGRVDPMATLIDAGRWHRAAEAARVEASHRPLAGSFLDPLAMGSTLVAMVVCYFLAPDYARWYLAVAAAWFIALAGPAATIAAGGGDASRRGVLLRSAPGAPRLPGSYRHALGATWLSTAIFGWPAAVAAVLWGGAAATPCGPLTAVVVLAALAGMIVVIVSLMEVTTTKGRRDGDGGAALAAVLVAAMVALFIGGLFLPACPSLCSSARHMMGESNGSRC